MIGLIWLAKELHINFLFSDMEYLFLNFYDTFSTEEFVLSLLLHGGVVFTLLSILYCTISAEPPQTEPITNISDASKWDGFAVELCVVMLG